MRRSRLWCAAILVSAAVAGPAAPAQAATPGVNIAGPPDAALVQKVIDSGAKSVRIFTAWNGFEPGGPGDYPTTANSDYSLHLRQQVFDDGLQQLNAHGIKPLYVLIDTPAWANGGAGVLTPPTNPQSFANWAGEFAAHNRARGGQVLGYEIWNEADGPDFWHPGPDLGQYVALLKAAHKAIKAGDPAAVVVTAPLVGNNADWLRQLYGAGAGDSFEAVAVHTDTACLVNAPDVFYREDNGDLARFSFLGYRTVRQVMVENGDAGKPIFMSELGWSSTNGGPTSCARGTWAGQKPDGVSEAKQAEFLKQAFACLANDPYVTDALWFTMQDTSIYPLNEMNHYGLLRTDGSKKASYPAFQALAAKNGGAAGSCGDFDGPSLQVLKPADGEQFIDKIDVVSAASDDGVGMARVTYTFDAGQKIRSWAASAGVDFREQVRLAPWYGAKNLAPGQHTIEITAVDQNGNTTTKTVTVQKVSSFAATLLPSMKLGRPGVKCRGALCSIAGQLQRGKAGSPSIGGHVAVEWQFLNKKKKWRKLMGGRKPAHKPFRFSAKLKQRGRWRVRMVYLGQAPWKPTQSKFLYFRV